MIIVGTEEAAVERDLVNGILKCPNCRSSLRPWGHGLRERSVFHRQPSAAASGAQYADHVYQPMSWSTRTPSSAAVIAQK